MEFVSSTLVITYYRASNYKMYRHLSFNDENKMIYTL